MNYWDRDRDWEADRPSTDLYRIKPLEWVECDDRPDWREAETTIGGYHIQGCPGRWMWCLSRESFLLEYGYASSMDDAMKVAEDYHRAMLASMLEVVHAD